MNVIAMKPLCYLVFLFCLPWSACNLRDVETEVYNKSSRISLPSVDALYKFLTYSDRRFPLISAHRGGPEPGYPENALETFQHSALQQPLIIECDIALSKDSVLVLMHDDRLDRTSTGKGLLNRYTLDELRQFNLKDEQGKVTPYKIPTLAEVLNWGKGKVLFTLDLKREVPVKMVVQAVRESRAEASCIMITYNASQAAAVYKEAPDLMISASIQQMDDLIRLNDYGVPDNRLVAFVGTHEPQARLYEQLHDHGILCILGTMGNLDRRANTRGNQLYYELIERGADIISTDQPRKAGKQMKTYRQKHNLELVD